MITSRRDYMVRIIEELGRLLARLSVRRRQEASDETALEEIVMGFQRLFGLDADQIFQLNPDQHFDLLSDDDSPEFVRDKLLLYAALSMEAGHIYARKGNTTLARATFLNALRFTLRATQAGGIENLPAFAPKVAELRTALGSAPLDADTAALLAASAGNSHSNSPCPSSGGFTPRNVP